MEHYDSQMAARVWQRVQGGREAADPTSDILTLLQEESTDLSRYRQLAAMRGLTAKPELSLLTEKTQQCVSILQGIWFLLTDKHPKATPSPLPKELPVSSLRRCYGGTLQRISRYGALSQHPEYAPGFLLLEQLSHERCQLLLQLLGNLRSS